MRVNKAVAMASIAALVLVLGVTTVGAKSTIFKYKHVLGSTPGSIVEGVAAAGAPWVVAEGKAKLDMTGELEVEVEGLLLTGLGPPRDGTTGTVTGVRASVTCKGSNTFVTTGVVPLSPEGNAEIEEVISPIPQCSDPIVLIRIGSTTTNPGPIAGSWIAIAQK